MQGYDGAKEDVERLRITIKTTKASCEIIILEMFRTSSGNIFPIRIFKDKEQHPSTFLKRKGKNETDINGKKSFDRI